MRTELAHILYMDIVGYSRASMEGQARVARELRQRVREAPEFQRAEVAGELLCLDTGDGLALVFSRDPLSPLQCAYEVARQLPEDSRALLRMGIHSGPISRVQDINSQENVTGSGINIAQRVMDSAQPGQILLSKTSAEIALEFDEWARSIYEIGEVEVKHSARLHLYNFFDGVVGLASVTAGGKSAGPATSETGRQVAILYKRGASPDEWVLSLIEKELGGAAYRVFVDRHLAIGVEWATEIERQVRGSYAVIPLLSEASIHSEMLEYEIETAHSASQQQNGTPRILPVRVNYREPLPAQSPIAVILNPLHYFLWSGPADDSRLVEELKQALRNPAPSRVDRARLETVGGAVPLDSEFYIVRPSDDEFMSAINRKDSIVLVKGARQMGKTSLLARGLQNARDSGSKVILTDFQSLNAEHLESAESLFIALSDSIADQLDLEVFPLDVWNERRGPSVNFERYMKREVLGAQSAPLVWGMDEVDRLFSCSYGSEVFGLFRSWHNRRSLEPAGPWSRLTLAIAYATEAHLFITDLNQSPFNVGTRIPLDDFTLDQVAELNARYGSPLTTGDELTRFYELLAGHPYLTRRGLSELVLNDGGIPGLEARADREDGPFGDHLRRILIGVSADSELLKAVAGILSGGSTIAADVFYRLRSAGILTGGSASEARLRCRLYERFLARHILESS